MKRRDLILATAGLAGGLVPALARAAKPCPPPQVTVQGGTTASTACAVAAPTPAPAPAPPPSGGEYTTSFSTDQRPLGSPWVSPNVAGFFPVQAVGGIACGTVASDTGYPDCYAFHPGFSGDYEVESVIFKSSSLNTAVNHEVELHVCMAQNGSTVQSVEWLINHTGGAQLMKWSGPNDGHFFSELGVISGTAAPGACKTGDRMKFRKVGSLGTLFYDSGSGFRQLGQLTLPYTSGSPGMAFFYRNGANVQHFGFSDLIIRPL